MKFEKWNSKNEIRFLLRKNWGENKTIAKFVRIYCCEATNKDWMGRQWTLSILSVAVLSREPIDDNHSVKIWIWQQRWKRFWWSPDPPRWYHRTPHGDITGPPKGDITGPPTVISLFDGGGGNSDITTGIWWWWCGGGKVISPGVRWYHYCHHPRNFQKK